MDISQLKGMLAPYLKGQATQAYDRFQQETGKADGDAFLQYLYEHKQIDRTTFCELHDAEPVSMGADDKSTLVPWDPRQPEAPIPAPERRYELLGEVGRGAMGVVHVARDNELGRKVAIKRLSKHYVRTGMEGRFLGEVRVTAQLDHPNIVPVYSLQVAADGVPSYAMKLVRGRTLEEILDETRVQIEQRGQPDEQHELASRLDILIRVCDAVAYAHSKGVLHRDLKPANIMVGQFHEVYVMDWGIARLIDGVGLGDDATEDYGFVELPMESTASRTRTRMGAVVGTPAYMSPEQAQGKLDLLGPESDVYSLGLMLYEVVLLRPALYGHSGIAVLDSAVNGRLQPFEPTRLGEPVSPELGAIVRKATAIQPSERYETPEELADDIRRHLRGDPTLALPDNAVRATRRWMLHHPGITAGTVGLLLLGSAFAGVANTLAGRARLAEERLVAAQHQRAITDILSHVSQRAQRIDNHFLYYEGSLEGIAAAATQALVHGNPVDEPTYDAAAYRSEATWPPGMRQSEHYKRPISPVYPVYKVAQGVDEAVWRPDLQRISALRPLLRDTAMSGPDRPAPPLHPDAQAALITGDDVPMEWAYVAVQRSGLMYMFPGAEGWDDAYDARTRPWYRDGMGLRQRVWGTPYVDLMGQGVLISCIKAMYDDGGDLLGVAGVDVQFDYIVEHYMRIDELKGFEGAWLLDDHGRVVVETSRTSDEFEKPETEALDPGLDFGLFDNAHALAGIAEGQSGTVVEHSDDGDVLVAWAPMQHLGWALAVRLDAEEALENE